MVDEHPWVPIVRDWLRRCSGHPASRPTGSEDVDLQLGLTTTQVLLGALGARKDAISKADAMKVGAILKQLGFKSHQVRREDDWQKREWRYFAASQPTQPDAAEVVTHEQASFLL